MLWLVSDSYDETPLTLASATTREVAGKGLGKGAAHLVSAMIKFGLLYFVVHVSQGFNINGQGNVTTTQII